MGERSSITATGLFHPSKNEPLQNNRALEIDGFRN